MAEKLLRIGEVAALFRVTPAAVRDWEKAGKITAFRTPGGQRRYRRAEIEALLPDDLTDSVEASA